MKNNKNKTSAALRALPWLAPVLVLIAAIVAYPMGLMIFNSTRKISRIGRDKGFVGLDNYTKVLSDPALPRVLANTAIWVIAVVVITIVLSLALANFLNKAFPGRRLVRLAVIIPWAASVVMTTTVVYYSLQPKLGLAQQFLKDIGLTSRTDLGITSQPIPAFLVAIAVAVFVSLPFTTYTLLAGHQAITNDVLEAARVDGASKVRTYAAETSTGNRHHHQHHQRVQQHPNPAGYDRRHPRQQRRHHDHTAVQIHPRSRPRRLGQCPFGSEFGPDDRHHRDLSGSCETNEGG